MEKEKNEEIEVVGLFSARIALKFFSFRNDLERAA